MGALGEAAFPDATHQAWVDSAEAPTFRVLATKDNLSLTFTRVMSVAHWSDTIERVMRGEGPLPRVGMSAAQLGEEVRS